MRGAQEAAGALLADDFGGLAVEATMQLSHVDRIPLGDIAASISSVVCTSLDVDFLCRFIVAGKQQLIKVSDIANEIPIGRRNGLAVARRVSARIKDAVETLQLMP